MGVVSEAKHQGRGRRSKAGSGLGMVDTHVDSRLRSRRTLLGMTFQQIQKHEHGTNGIAAPRLGPLAEVLHVPVSFFDDDMPDTVPRTPEPFDPETLAPPSGQPSLQRRPVTPVKAQASQATTGGQQGAIVAHLCRRQGVLKIKLPGAKYFQRRS